MSDRPSILVIDDEPNNFDVIQTLLGNEGYTFHYASSGQRALDQLDRLQPDTILLDVMMPDLDGYETMREIRKLPQFRTLPILALTAKAMKGDREKCLNAGASDYIAKPVNTNQLLSLMRVWLFR